MKNIYIYCDGGFGNRFNSLVCGLSICLKTGFEPIIVWPLTNWCRSKFSTLFSVDLEVIEENLHYFEADVQSYEFLMHGNFLNFNTNVYHPESFGSLEIISEFCVNTEKKKIVYNNDTLLSYLSEKQIVDVIRSIGFNSELVDKANDFINANLGESFTGVHLRNTDFYDPHKPNFDQIFNQVFDNKDTRYFVCSDDEELENKFNQLENVFVYPKTSYVEKLTDEGEWRSVIVDDTGVEYPFNVERSDESVRQAIVDLYILSKSDIMKTSNSSFLQTAFLLKKSYQDG